MLKEIKEETNKWKDISCSQIGRINIFLDVSIIQSDVQIRCNSYQNPENIFCGNSKIHSRMHMESQGTPNDQNDFEKKKNQAMAFILPDVKTCYKATVVIRV